MQKLIFYEQGRKMSTWRRYIMRKVQKYDNICGCKFYPIGINFS